MIAFVCQDYVTTGCHDIREPGCVNFKAMTSEAILFTSLSDITVTDAASWGGPTKKDSFSHSQTLVKYILCLTRKYNTMKINEAMRVKPNTANKNKADREFQGTKRVQGLRWHISVSFHHSVVMSKALMQRISKAYTPSIPFSPHLSLSL